MKKLKYVVPIMIALTLLLVACGGNTAANGEVAQEDASPTPAGDPAKGQELYSQVCVACHGPDGAGVEGLGKPFTTSEFVRSHSDQELLEFVKTGRPISDPENTTGVDMPPKGGNPALTDEQIMDIIAYIRTLQE